MIHDAIESQQISLSDSLAVADKRRRLNIEIDFTSSYAATRKEIENLFASNSNITGRLLRLERINLGPPPPPLVISAADLGCLPSVNIYYVRSQ